jgi:hypothetical protein
MVVNIRVHALDSFYGALILSRLVHLELKLTERVLGLFRQWCEQWLFNEELGATVP